MTLSSWLPLNQPSQLSVAQLCMAEVEPVLLIGWGEKIEDNEID